jgi:hypothetical protein
VAGRNRPPEVTVGGALVATSDPGVREFRVEWTGHDPDGRIDQYLVALNPASPDRVDAAWKATTDRSCSYLIRAGAGAAGSAGAQVVAVRAVDDQGALSEPSTVRRFPNDVAPTVVLTSPRPSPLLTPIVTPTLTLTWLGEDSDGDSPVLPTGYEYLLLGPGSEFPISLAVANPDSLRRFYAPGFAGWTTLGAQPMSLTLTDLTVDAEYLFVITATDAAGNYDPVFSLSKNMLHFRVGYADALGPRLTVQTGSFLYQYPYGSWNTDPGAFLNAGVPAAAPVPFAWSSTPQPGAEVEGYRWVLDPADIDDPATRTSPGDVHHWSAEDATTSVTLDAFDPGTEHLFCIEAVDSYGHRSLAAVRLHVAATGSF